MEHHKSVAFLRHLAEERKLRKSAGGGCLPLVLIMHHLFTYKSVAPAYLDHPLNPCFASHTDDVVTALAPDLVVHGHTHSSLDYMHGGSRVICNPHGYGEENPSFNPRLIVDIARGIRL